MAKLFLPDSVAPSNRTASNLWVPKHLRPAVKRIAVVFYYNPTDKRIIVGFPDNFPVPPSFAKAGYQKIVCTSAHELEIWSQKLRDQEKRDEEMSEEQRERLEGPIRDWARKELISSMMNARNPINREFCRAALQKLDEDTERRKMKKISYMHQEGFEDGK